MKRKAVISAAAAVVLGAALLLVLWAMQRPAIRPDQVRLEAILHPPGHGENLLPYGHEAWTLEIILDKETEQPLWADEWSFAVTPVIGGIATPFWDHMQGLSTSMGSPPAGGEGFVVLRDMTVWDGVVRAVESEGLNPGAQRWAEVWSFRYHGEAFPARIRFYLDGGLPPQVDRAAVAYTHKERRWGRDLGWTRLFPATVAEGPPAAEREGARVAEAVFLEPGQILNRAEVGEGHLGDLQFSRGQVLLWRPEPQRLAVTAVFQTAGGEWNGGGSSTIVALGPHRPIATAAVVNPVTDRERKVPLWALFGEVDDPEITEVWVEMPGKVSITVIAPVVDGAWLVAHLGEIPADSVSVQYATAAKAVKGRGRIRLDPVQRP
ncbi:MAG: hypothetical protein ACOY94_09960 [Bacillota bacterium]